MLTGAHSIIYSTDAAADRAFLQDVLALPSVDVGEGWLIFGLPPAEVAVHPGSNNDKHEFYLMFDDVNAFVAEMKSRGIKCGPVQDEGWGVLTHVTLPGGGKLGAYQPRHARPPQIRIGSEAKPRSSRRSAASTRKVRRPARKVPGASKRRESRRK